MKFLYLFIFSSVFILGCSKEETEKPFVKQVLYFDDFSGAYNWLKLPSNSIFQPDTTCVRIENNLLKISFDQPLPNCGGAWVGAENNDPNILTSQILDKIGVRIKLNKGYFQEITRFFDTTDVNGVHGQQGAIISNLKLDFNGLNIQIPNSSNGRVHRDSIINPNLNKIEGNEFELIYNEGEKTFKIDGINQSLNLIYFNYATMFNKHLDIEFTIGHQPEFSPRLDEIYIDEIEIYTWQGKLKN